MPFNGSGVYVAPSLPGSFNPAISGQQATPTDFNTLLTDLSTALSTTITSDGQSTVTANIPFAGFKLTGVGNATVRTDVAPAGQVQDGKINYAIDTGTADLYAIAPTPAVAVYLVGQEWAMKVVNANLTTTPTLAVSGLPNPGTITWPDGSALAAGDMPAGAVVSVRVSSVTGTTPTFQLQTRARTINQSSTVPTYQNFTSGSAATYNTPAGVKWIKVRVVGGGGGGGGCGGTTGLTGGTGGTTIFNSVNAVGGTGGTGTTTNTPGAGGAAGTGGTGTATMRVTGQAGGSGIAAAAAGQTGSGAGGSAPFFGGGGLSRGGAAVASGVTATANTGGGGSGAESPNTTAPAGGGGSGEYYELIIGSPAATYTYTVGAAGAGGIGTGTGAATGGAGAAGYITVEEHYNA